jgi:hypothetical protein
MMSPPIDSGFEQNLWAEDARKRLDVALASPKQADQWRDLRRKVRRIVNAVNAALADHPALRDHDALPHLILLSLALDALDSGVPHPLFKVKAGNRAHETNLSRQFRLIVLQLTDAVIRAGASRIEAYRFIAAQLTKAGVGGLKSGGPFKASLIERWYQRTVPHPEKNKDAELPDDADWLFGRRLTSESATVDEAKAWVRCQLQLPIVRALFPTA